MTEIKWEQIDENNYTAQVGTVTLCCKLVDVKGQEYSSWQPTVHLCINGSIMSNHATHAMSLDIAKHRCVILARVMLDETVKRAEANRRLLD